MCIENLQFFLRSFQIFQSFLTPLSSGCLLLKRHLVPLKTLRVDSSRVKIFLILIEYLFERQKNTLQFADEIPSLIWSDDAHSFNLRHKKLINHLHLMSFNKEWRYGDIELICRWVTIGHLYCAEPACLMGHLWPPLIHLW